MIKYEYITDPEILLSWIQAMRERKKYMIALDTEYEQNLHVFGEKLCLIQIFDGTHFLIVDPLQMDVEALRVLFESRDILKIMYDANSEVALLKRVYKINIVSILDLRPAVDLLKYEKQDLHSVIFAELGIELMGKKNFQTRNWINRPIPNDALEYAISDVQYLFPLKERMLKKLVDKNLIDIYMLRNLQVQNKVFSESPLDKYIKIPGYIYLDQQKQEIFRKVFDLRHHYAQKHNIPPYHVIGNKDLIAIANDANTVDELRFPGVLGSGDILELIAALKSAGATPRDLKI